MILTSVVVTLAYRPFIQAGILRKTPNIKRGKDRGKAPTRDEGEYPWFCKGGEFVGERVNDMHLLSADKQAGRKLKGVEM